MNRIPYYMVDVFAEQPFAGNPLAVFLRASALSDEDMLHIAKEIGYSEVTFLDDEGPEDDGWRARIFTPEGEIPFAGHPSLGSAYIIQSQIQQEPVDTITLRLKSGEIPISFHDSDHSAPLLWMQQLPPVFTRVVDPARIQNMLHLDAEDMDPRFPIQEVSTGLPTLIVPLRDADSVHKAKLHRQAYFELVQQLDAKMIHLFAPAPGGSADKLRVRNFGDYYGVSEEPATGSANGCLAGYLVKHGYFPDPQLDIRVEQGREIQRLGHIYLRARQQGETIQVQVGGRVRLMAKGEFIVPGQA